MKLTFPKETFIEKEKRKVFFSYWLKRVFLEDWLVKLTALGITMALWFVVMSLQEPTTTRLTNVPLNLLLSEQLEITNSYAQEVNLAVIGEKRKIDQLHSRDLRASLDLTEVLEGESMIRITPQNVTVDLPDGVKINEITPNEIAVKLEKVEEYEIPVRAETIGDLAPGYEVYSMKITPEKVRVRGPRSFVKSLSFVSTEKINLENQKTSFSASQTRLNITSPKVKLLTADSASVFVRVGKKRIERLFVVPYETETRKGKASILLYGPDSVLEQMTAEDLQILEKELTETGGVRLEVVLPTRLKDEVEVKSKKFR